MIALISASLRTSRTWTDGADNGKENIPFVRPHPPPSGLSSERIRRKPRVKSAGKERTPHTGFTGENSMYFLFLNYLMDTDCMSYGLNASS